MAVLRLLRAPAWQHRCSRPCWTPAPSPGRGSRHAHRPSEGHSAQLLLQPPPPPLYQQTPLTPPPSPWDERKACVCLRQYHCVKAGIAC